MPIVDNGRDAETSSDSRQSSGMPSASIADVFAQALWRGRWIVVSSVMVGALVGLFIARSMQPVYEAAATLLITESRESEAVSTPETLSAIAGSDAMASRVVSSLRLDRPPYGLTADTFRARHVAIDALRGSRMIQVKVTLPDPALAARGADEVARQTVELARNLNQQDTVFLRDYLAAQLEAARTRKEQLQHEMLAYRADSQLELVETDADALLQQRSQLSKLAIDIAAEEARVATAERELATQDRILKAPRHAQIEGALLSLSDAEERRSVATTSQTTEPSRIATSQPGTVPSGTSPGETPASGAPAGGTLPGGTALSGTPPSGTESGTSQSGPPQSRTLQGAGPSSQIGASQTGVAQIGTPPTAIPQTAIERYEQSDRAQIHRPVNASPDQPTSSDDSPSIPPQAIGDFVNPVYEILDYQAAMGRTRLAALRRERDELVRVLKVDAHQLATLGTMYRTQIELRKLQTEYDLAEKIYLDLSMKHEQARVQAVSRSSHVQVLDSAALPTEPVAPRKRRIVAAGAVSGLLLALAGVIVIAALRSGRRHTS